MKRDVSSRRSVPPGDRGMPRTAPVGTVAFLQVDLNLDKECLEVRCGHIGVPRRRIPLSHVAGAEFTAHVNPRHWGGWGYRWRPEKGTAVVVRRGEGVVLRLWDGHTF